MVQLIRRVYQIYIIITMGEDEIHNRGSAYFRTAPSNPHLVAFYDMWVRVLHYYSDPPRVPFTISPWV